MAGPDEGVKVGARFDERAGFAVDRPADLPAVADPADRRGLVPRPAAAGELPARKAIAAALSRRALVRFDSALRDALLTEWERGTPFLFVPVFLAAGALVYFAVDGEPGFGALGASVAALSLAAWLARSRILLHLALSALLCFALGMLSAKIETWRAGTRMLGSEISTRLTGRVAAIEPQASGRTRLVVDVLSTDRPRLRFVPDRVRLSASKMPDGLRTGEVVAGIVRLAPPTGPTRPGGYDFSFESYFDGIGASGFFLKGPDRVADSPPPDAATGVLAMVENLRAALAGRIRGAIGGDAEGEIAAALIAGVRGGIPDDVNEALRRTGLAHVLSISGLHMALVAAAIMFSLRGGFALFPGIASRRPVKKYAAAAALAALAVYLFISGMAVAAERSFLMIGIMLLAVMFDRAAISMRNLAISAVVIIAVSPHEVAGPSFQMSFAATAALIGGYAAWSERRRRPRAVDAGHGLPRRVLGRAGAYVGGLAATSLIAGTATAVFGAYHFQRVSALGLAANLAAMPIVSLVVMPFALIGMMLMPFGLDQWAFAVMGKGLTAMIAVAQWFSALSPFDAVGLVPASGVLVLTAALIAATLPTTWLRLTAVPIAIAGLALVATRSLPVVLVSEDGRLMAIRSTDGAIAVNRARPNRFTTDDWRRALAADEVFKPKNAAAGDLDETVDGNDDGFRCAGDTCAFRMPAGPLVLHAATAAAAEPFCASASLIVIDDATAENPCPERGPAVVTSRDLARRGAAAVVFDGSPRHAAEVTFAIEQPYRPWHAQRAFSRAARGLAPYERRKQESGRRPAARAGKP